MPSSELKLLTLNIAHGRGPILHQGLVKQKTILKWMEKIADLLMDHQPDIVALQEIDEDSQWNGNLDLLEFLRSKAGYENASYGMHNRHDGKYRLNYGNAFLSKFPIIAEELVVFDKKKLAQKDSFTAVVKLHLDSWIL